MKTLNSKKLIGLMLLALIIGLNGCMTQSAIQYGKGTPGKAWSGLVFTQQQVSNTKPKPLYYLLVPVTIPADIVTFPVQIIVVPCGLLNAEAKID